MSTIDEILASGRYADKRGRGWDYVETVASWCSPEIDAEGVSWGYRYLDTAQMRLLIERDQHRDECPRVGVCRNHPVPRATFCDVGGFDIWAAGELTKAEFARPCIATLPEAMDAARALAVGE